MAASIGGRDGILLVSLVGVWIGVSALGLVSGAVRLEGLWEGPMAAVLWEIRLPRILLGGLAGLSLAVAGAAWQGVLRNPLADPYLIGASAGAALGAALSSLYGVRLGPIEGLPLMAFLGALAAVGLVCGLARGRGSSVERLLLAGVAVSSFLSACLSLLLWGKAESFARFYFWMIGGLSGRGWEHLGTMAPYALFALGGLVYLTPRLNVLQLGEEVAMGLGIEARRDRRLAILFATLLTAAVVSTCGMIGFVGLVVPHLARLIVGPDFRRALPVSALMGASLLVGADWLARTMWSPAELPVGILTAMLGAPFFLYLLRRGA